MSTVDRIRFLEDEASGLTLRTRLILGGVVLVIIAGLAVAFWPAKPIHEVTTAAPEVRQGDGSLIAERTPQSHPAPAPHIIPSGYKETRRDSVTVAPSPAAAASGCPPVSVILSTVRSGNQQRIVASSPNGEVLAAKDEIIEPALLPPAPRPWAAGLSYDTRHAVGVWVDRDVGRLVLGAAVARLPDGKAEAQLRVGVRF